jgi:hypothetical protein
MHAMTTDNEKRALKYLRENDTTVFNRLGNLTDLLNECESRGAERERAAVVAWGHPTPATLDRRGHRTRRPHERHAMSAADEICACAGAAILAFVFTHAFLRSMRK